MYLSRHRGLIASWPKISRYLGGIIVASVLASSASAPFGITTVWSVLANVVGMPLMGVVVIPFGAAALFLMPLGLEGYQLAVMGWGLDGLNLIAGYTASQPFSKIAVPPPSALVLILFTASLILPHCLSGRWRMLSLITLGAGMVAWIISPVPVAVFTSLHQRPIAAFHG
jgi:competence protein ComEC